jgi:hypothetical protein
MPEKVPIEVAARMVSLALKAVNAIGYKVIVRITTRNYAPKGRVNNIVRKAKLVIVPLKK